MKYALDTNIVSLLMRRNENVTQAFDNDFLAAHPEITVEKKSDSPEEDKSVGDARLLIPTLKDFFNFLNCLFYLIQINNLLLRSFRL